MSHPSIDTRAGTAVVRVACPFYWGGRVVAPRGLHRGLLTVSIDDAVRLVLTRRAKAIGDATLRNLQDSAALQRYLTQ